MSNLSKTIQHEKAFLVSLVLVTGPVTTLIVTPWFNYDPINLPKMLALSFLTFPMIFLVFRYYKNELIAIRTLCILSISFCILLTVPVLFAETPWQTQIWGAWGRSTGLIAFLSLTVLFVSSALISTDELADRVLKLFLKVSYLVSIYTSLQYLGLDPVPWSQKLPVATLGNINFMSAFLGMASVAALSRVLNSKDPILSKVYFLGVVAFNVVLILLSGSIQGLLVLIIGGIAMACQSVGFFSYAFWKKFLYSIFGLVLIILLALGGVGIGPLGEQLKQDTLLYRIDYWRAGARMTLTEPIHGVGLDGYGDFYRAYRDSIATFRTSPSRVSNTAHNIFLDVSSGGGVILLTIYVCIFLYVTKSAYQLMKEKPTNVSISLFCLWLGYTAFCTISINQLGVSCWGWIFAGLIIGLRHKNISDKIVTTVPRGPKVKTMRTVDSPPRAFIGKPSLGVFSFSMIGILVSLPAFITDGVYLEALKQRDTTKVLKTSTSWSSSEFHAEKSIEFFIDMRDVQSATQVAKWLISRNHRNFMGQNTIRLLVSTTESERQRAIEELLTLDPKNLPLREELEQQMAGIRGGD